MAQDLSLRLEALGFNRDDFELEDKGEGPYISVWRGNRPRPPQAALNAIPDTAITAMRNARKRGRAVSANPDLALAYAVADALNVPRETFINNIKDIYETL